MKRGTMSRGMLAMLVAFFMVMVGGGYAGLGPSDARAGEEEFKDFDNRKFENFDFENFDKEELRDFDNEKVEDFNFEDFNNEEFKEFKDEDMNRLAEGMKFMEKDLDMLFKDEENVNRFFDLNADKQHLTREDFDRLRFLHDRMLKDFDNRFAHEEDFEDRDEGENDAFEEDEFRNAFFKDQKEGIFFADDDNEAEDFFKKVEIEDFEDEDEDEDEDDDE